MSKILMLICLIAIVGCSPARFNRELASSMPSNTQTNTQPNNQTNSQTETVVTEPTKNNPVPNEPIPETKKNGIKVLYPFQASFIDVLVGTTSQLKIINQSGICKVLNETAITNEAYLCNDDSGLFKDFCSTTEKIISDKNDYTCQQLEKSQNVLASQGACTAQQVTLLTADLRELQDPTQYQVVNLDVQNTVTANDLFSAATKIGLTTDCQCYYQTANPDFNLYTAQWPAMNSHCHKYFPDQYK